MARAITTGRLAMRHPHHVPGPSSTAGDAKCSSSLEVEFETGFSRIRCTVAQSWCEHPLLDQTQSLVIEVGPLRTLYNGVVDSAVSRNHSAQDDVGVCTAIAGFWLRHLLSKGAAISLAQLAYLGLRGRREHIRGGVG